MTTLIERNRRMPGGTGKRRRLEILGLAIAIIGACILVAGIWRQDRSASIDVAAVAAAPLDESTRAFSPDDADDAVADDSNASDGEEPSSGFEPATSVDDDVESSEGADSGDSPDVSEPDRPTQTEPPLAVRIPILGVESSLIDLGLNDDRTIEVPEAADQAGWYKHRPVPGDPGPSVILGHVDSYTGPGVFFELRTLQVGDLVDVDRADGTTAIFRVTSVEQHAKDAFPTERVYGSTDDSELRLVTCGGVFDEGQRSYLDNIIVFASLVEIVDTVSD